MSLASSHDLRQPLTAIQNFTRACINELRRHPEGAEKVFGWLESVNQQAKRASEMLKESKPQGLSMNYCPGPMEIKLCIERIREGLKGEISISAGVVNAKSDGEPYFLVGDPDLLEAVFRDLLVTAIDSTPRSGTRPQSINIGIDRDNADLMFEIGTDAPVCGSTGGADAGRATEHSCSSGTVGLSACDAIIKRHGGSLLIWRRQDGAVRVRARLPAYRPHEGSA